MFPWRTRSVHVWAVDRGIVLAGGGNAPDPFSHFYGRRAHQVTGEDSALDLLPDVRRLAGTQTIGGDSGEPELDALYRNPVPTEHASSAIVWRRALALPAEASEIAIPLEVPRFSGTLEFFAVVIEGDRYGSATARTEVTSPLILEASWPRFAAPGDRFTVPVRLVNRTGSKATIAIEAVTSGPVTLELDASPRTLAAGEALTLRVPAKAGGLGAVTVDLRARPLLHGKWGAHLGQTRGAFRVRPALGLTTRTRTLSLTAGEPLELDLSEGFVPSSVRAALTIGGDPNLDLAPLVGGLLDYPYGCLEQTSSRMLALLCAPELARLRDPDAEDRNAFARAALALGFRRLSTMQTSRGGLSYWPGGSECHVFGSIWTALRIADAERHAIGGIPGGLRPGLVRYLREVLARPTNDTERDPNTRAQICHALAALGVPERGFAEHLRERPQDLDLEGLSSLAAAYHLTAEPEPAARLLELAAKHVAGARFVSEPGGPRLTSRARQLGAFLAVLAQVDPASPLAAQTAERLLEARKGARFSNTLENATALLGLSRLAAARGPRALQTFRGTLAVGPEGRAHRFSHEAPLHVELEGERVSITLSGEGTAYLALTVRGVPLEEAGAHEPTDRGLRVRRRFLDAEGVERSLTEVRGGELLTVELELNAPGLNAWDRRGEIVILDLLPGGFEIENPRLATSVGRLDTGAAERTELLSDRAIFFTSAGPEVSTYRYTIRAVTEGDFAVPPPHASSMYDPGLTSVGGFDAQRRAQVRR
ncbi:MAG: alpha-2-macroglobulin family protein [Planctomycetota bacterium]